MVEGRYTLAVLFEYAATLGLVDVEYVDPSGARDDFHHTWGGEDLDALSRYDGLHAIRLTSLGCYALGLASGHDRRFVGVSGAQARTSLRSPRSRCDSASLPRRPGDARTWTPDTLDELPVATTNGASPQPVEPCRGAGWVWGSGRLGSPVAGVPVTGI